MCYDCVKEVKSKFKLIFLYFFYIGYVLSVIYKMYILDFLKELDVYGWGGREIGLEEKFFEIRVFYFCWVLWFY